MALWQLVTANSTAINLDAGNGVVVTQTYGMGMPPVGNQTTDYAVLDGGSFQRSKAAPRVMMMQIEAVGNALTSTNGLHTIRARLLNAINPHRAQPVRLNYTGNGSTRYLNCYYEAGLEGGDLAGFTEQMTLRLLAPDPFWKANTASASTVPTSETKVLDEIARWTDGVWSSMGGGGMPSTSATGVRVLLAKPGGGVYAGGFFGTMGGVAAVNVAVLASATTTTWAALGAGITGTAPDVYTGAVAPNGDVYLGGGFNQAGGTAAKRVAVRDVSAGAWAALGAGVPGITRACAVDHTGVVYFSGAWSTAGATAAARIAKWNGANWAALGAGFAGANYAYALAVDHDNNLYAGGTLNTAGGAAAAKIAKWNGTAWSTLGSGMTDTVYALEYDSDLGYLYAGGAFHTAGGVAALHVARWNGQQWEPLGGGVDNQVFRLKRLANGWLLASGQFNEAGGNTAHYAALWNGYAWVHLPAKLTSTIYAFAEDDTSGAWYFGGIFDGSQTVSGRKSITNSGTARAYPVITVTAAAASQRLLYIRNDTTDQTLWFNYLLQEGETVTIDCTPGAKSVTSSYYGTAVGNNPLPGSQLATFALAPGDNSISTLVDGASTTVTFTYRATYWGLD